MRLIDADELEKKSILHIRGEYGYSARSENWVVLVKDINNTPTVDPETLPIVQELREELAKVTAEMDALLKEVAGECGLCLHYDTCKNSDKNTCFLGSEWEWRGIE